MTKKESAPFIHPVQTVARKIVDGIETKHLRLTQRNAKNLTAHYYDLDNEKRNRTHLELADRLTLRDGHASSSQIGRVNLPGNYVSEAVAYTFITADLFASWPDLARRYLLDRALHADIKAFEEHDTKVEVFDIYIAPETQTVYDRHINKKLGIFYIPELQKTQAKLRERVSPFPPLRLL